MRDLNSIQLVTEPTAEYLNQRQRVDYEQERTACMEWLLALGKNPDRGEGYALGTVEPRAYRMDMFYRWVWEQEDGYVANVSVDHADDWLRALARADYSSTHKTNCQKALQMLFKWREHERGSPAWEPSIRFSEDNSTRPRDYLTRDEREAVRSAALEYGSIPSYANLAPPERDRWRQYLAQRLGKPATEVTPDDWERVNGWKIPSLVWVSLDAGLRPVEVSRSEPAWVDTDNSVLRIPKEQSAKSRDNWVVSLRRKTATILAKWLEQRQTRPKYDHSEALWLTRECNTYESQSLRYVLQRLCEIADIETGNRQMSWYAIRHSVGTYMTREEDLAAAQAQLRHKSPQTTMKYDQTPVEDRRDALDRM